MRDLLIAGIFACVVPFALMHAWIGVLLWNWVSLMNPHKLTYGFAFNLPFAAIAGGAALLSVVLGRDKLRMPKDAPVVVLLLFVIWMCFTTALAIDPAGSVDQLSKVLKIQLMTGVAFAVIQSRKHIELFIWVCALSVGFYGVKGGIWTLLSGGGERVWGPPGSFIEDNNELAVALIMTIPFLNYLRLVSSRAIVRHGLLVMMLLIAVSALGSQSRGAFLAISAMTVLLWMRSQRKMLSAVTIVVAASSIVAFMPASWEKRMSTIQTYEADNSAMSRLVAWKFCYEVANDRPTGGGFGVYTWENYSKYSPAFELPQAAHSIYFSVLGEHGWPGLLLYLLVGVLSYRLASRLRRETRDQPKAAWVYYLAGMCQVTLIGFAVGGSFLSLAYFDYTYNVLVVLVATRRWVDDRGWEKEPTGPFGSGDPVGRTALADARRGKAMA